MLADRRDKVLAAVVEVIAIGAVWELPESRVCCRRIVHVFPYRQNCDHKTRMRATRDVVAVPYQELRPLIGRKRYRRGQNISIKNGLTVSLDSFIRAILKKECYEDL